MTPKVFLHYTQAELDRNFDQRGWASNALEVIARYTERSRITRSIFAHQTNIAYGNTSAEVLDIFPAPRSDGRVQIFVHGGAWKNFTKDDYSFPASSFVPAGIHTVIVNFANLPAVRLPEMVNQVRRAFEWVYRNARTFGGDADKIYVSAQSSGAHLAASALQTDWKFRDIPDNFIKAATFVSGPYYLEPVVLSARSSYVKLSEAEVQDLSPGLRADRIKCPIVLGYAENDTDEFQRQTREFARALEKVGRLTKLVRFANINHFELMECFDDPSHALVQTILEQMGTPSLAKGRAIAPF
jgi:arylformamidase